MNFVKRYGLVSNFILYEGILMLSLVSIFEIQNRDSYDISKITKLSFESNYYVYSNNIKNRFNVRIVL